MDTLSQASRRSKKGTEEKRKRTGQKRKEKERQKSWNQRLSNREYREMENFIKEITAKNREDKKKTEKVQVIIGKKSNY